MVILQKSTNNKCWRSSEEKRTGLHSWLECNLVEPLWKIVQRFLRKLKIELPCDPSIPSLDGYPKNMKTLNMTKMYLCQCSYQHSLQ